MISPCNEARSHRYTRDPATQRSTNGRSRFPQKLIFATRLGLQLTEALGILGSGKANLRSENGLFGHRYTRDPATHQGSARGGEVSLAPVRLMLNPQP